MVKIFLTYCSIGVLNTFIHWLVFFTSIYLFEFKQMIANILGFYVAVTFSFT